MFLEGVRWLSLFRRNAVIKLLMLFENNMTTNIIL